MKFGSLIIAATAFVIVAQSADAATRLGNRYEDNGDATCSTTTTCSITFPATPADKFLIVKKFSCVAATAQPLKLAIVIGPGGRLLYLSIPAAIPVPGSNPVYTLNQDTEFMLGKNKTFFLQFQTAGPTVGPMSVECTFYGELFD